MAPYVTFQTYDVLPTICAMCPHKIIPRAKVPLKCNFANKSALFPQAAPCPFSIMGRTLWWCQSLIARSHRHSLRTPETNDVIGFVIRDSSSAIASGRGPSLPTPETNDTNTHTPPARIAAAYLSTLKLCCDISGNTRNEYL